VLPHARQPVPGLSTARSHIPRLEAMQSSTYLRILQGMRDVTEDQIKQLEDGRLKLVRVAANGTAVDVTPEQVSVLRNRLNELNRVIVYASVQ
jgi:hypothetical protein